MMEFIKKWWLYFIIGISGILFYAFALLFGSNTKVDNLFEYLINWWIDLYGKSLDKLCIELDEKNSNENRSNESKNTIKQWRKGTLPDKKSLEEHCSIELNYHGVFIPNEIDTINQKFQNAIEFIKNKKKISIKNLKHEIPYSSLVDKIFTSSI